MQIIILKQNNIYNQKEIILINSKISFQKKNLITKIILQLYIVTHIRSKTIDNQKQKKNFQMD